MVRLEFRRERASMCVRAWADISRSDLWVLAAYATVEGARCQRGATIDFEKDLLNVNTALSTKLAPPSAKWPGEMSSEIS